MSEEILQNINNQTYNPDLTIYFIVQDIKKIGSQSYKVTGNFSKPFEMDGEKELIKFYDFKTNLFNATLINTNEGNYQMSFSLPDYITISLNAVYALISEITIIRRLENTNDYDKLEFRELKENQLSLPLPTPETHNYGLKITKSSGLSGGAIAGIVIACVFALVGVAFVILFFLKPRPKPKDVSAIEFYNSSLSVIHD